MEAAEDVDAFFAAVTGFYKDYGVGMFGLNKAFRIKEKDGGDVEFVAINNMDKVMLDDRSVMRSRKRNWSTIPRRSWKAEPPTMSCSLVIVVPESRRASRRSSTNFYPDGLRMIEIYKHQFKDTSNVIASIKNRNYKFIIYMDDLSFEEFEISINS